MKANEIIVEVLGNTVNPDGSAYTQTQLALELTEKAEMCGGKGVTRVALNDRLKNENMKISTFIEMLDMMGYEVVARPKGEKDNRQTYVVEPGTDRKRVK